MIKNMGLRGKIYSGIGLVVALSTVVIISYQLTITQVIGRFTKLLDTSMRATMIGHNIDAATMDYDRSFKEFRLLHDKEALQGMKNLAKDSADALDALANLSRKTGDNALSAQVLSMQTLLKNYNTHRQIVVAASIKKGFNEKSGFQGSFRDAVHAWEATLKNHPDPRLESLMLTIRRHEKDYLLRGTQKYVSETNAVVQELKTAIRASSLDQAIQQTLAGQIAAYQKNFAALVDQNKIIKDATSIINADYHKFGPAIDKIVAEQSSAANSEISNAESAAVRNSIISMIIGIAGILAGILMAFLLGRGISRPIDKAVRELREGTSQVGSAASQVASGSQALADNSSEQAAALEETSASMEEMTSMTKRNSDNTAEADQLMTTTIKVVSKANDTMRELTASMAEIAQASNDTSKIIKSIDEIAFQTNLLALNAAVEAARAGEAGAGFAVVADEVRNLAMRSAEAAKSTAALIEGTVGKVQKGNILVEETSQAFIEVNEHSTKIGQLIKEVAAASNEQSTGVGQVNQAINQLDQAVQQIAANSEESASAAEEVNAQVASILGILSGLNILVNGSRAGGAASSQPGFGSPAVYSKPGRQRPAPARSLAKPAVKLAAKVANKVIPFDDDDNFEDF